MAGVILNRSDRGRLAQNAVRVDCLRDLRASAGIKPARITIRDGRPALPKPSKTYEQRLAEKRLEAFHQALRAPSQRGPFLVIAD